MARWRWSYHDDSVGDGDRAVNAGLAGKVGLCGEHGGTCRVRTAQLLGGRRIAGRATGPAAADSARLVAVDLLSAVDHQSGCDDQSAHDH